MAPNHHPVAFHELEGLFAEQSGAKAEPFFDAPKHPLDEDARRRRGAKRHARNKAARASRKRNR